MQGETSANDGPVIGVLTTREVDAPGSQCFLRWSRICVACDGLVIHSIAALVMNSKHCLRDMVSSNGHGRLAEINMICGGRR